MDTFSTPRQEESLGDYIKRLRTALNMSQNELASLAGIHLHSLGKIERGITTRLSQKTRRGLAKVLSVPTDYLRALSKGDEVTESVASIKFCPQCWVPGTPTESIWADIRSLYCFMCGTELLSHCLKCEKSVISFKHSYCPYCGFYYKLSRQETNYSSEERRKKQQ